MNISTVAPKASHVQPPWRKERARDGHFMIHECPNQAGVHTVSLAHCAQEENADFIIAAANSHYAMVAALRDAKAQLSSMRASYGSSQVGFIEAGVVIARINAALEKAGAN